MYSRSKDSRRYIQKQRGSDWSDQSDQEEREREKEKYRQRKGGKKREKEMLERKRERVIEEEGEQGGGVVTDERIHAEAFDKSFQPQKQLNLN